MRLSLLASAALAAFLIRPVPARAGKIPTQPCLGAIASAERSLRTPERLLASIARVESGRPDPRTGAVQPWPWTVNAEGIGRFFASKAEAIEAVEALQARGVRSIDVGCMQVNLMHHPNAFPSLEAAFEPQTNATYAARFLTALHRGFGDWVQATAAYHSQTQQLGTDYARKVMTVWGHPFQAPTAVDQERIFTAFATVGQQYRAFAPETTMFGAFASPSSLPPGWSGYAGVPAPAGRKRVPAR